MNFNDRLRLKNDYKFVFNLFYEHKVHELNAEAWPNEMKSQLIGMQFTAFEKSIISKYANLEDKIFCLDSIPIGRMVINRNASEINLLYISLLCKYQGKGYGEEILKSLIKESDRSKKALTLKVLKENPALSLYQKMGFKIIREDVTKFTMAYSNL